MLRSKSPYSELTPSPDRDLQFISHIDCLFLYRRAQVIQVDHHLLFHMFSSYFMLELLTRSGHAVGRGSKRVKHQRAVLIRQAPDDQLA